MDRYSPNQVPTYHVEHLATFSTASAQHEHVTPRMALQRLFKMEKTSGIWTQRMAIQLKGNHMWILDGETNDVVERFPVTLIQQPTSFNDQNHIYNNILIFTVQLPAEPQGELHIFQCVSHDAVTVVDDVYHWMRHYGVSTNGTPSGTAPAISPNSGDKLTPASNVNVKEAVTVFNQIAAQREKKGASSDSIHRLPHAHPDLDSRSDSSSFAESNNHRNHEIQEGYSNERYVSILNHCFDDIERFIIRLQHAAAALRELQIRSHKRGAKGSGDGLLAIRARGPNEEDFFEILSKFKLAFNLLAKLKGCIHDPNAPELVHFLFTPLAIIIEAARSNEPLVDPSLVGVPYLSNDAIELLSNCCTSKEYDLWQSLGLNWIQPVKHLRMNSPFQPVFTDGWAPSITEPELIGIASLSESENESDDHQVSLRPHISKRDSRNDFSRSSHFDDSDYEESNAETRLPSSVNRCSPSTPHGNRLANTSPSPIESLERDSPNGTHSIDTDQIDWVAELQSRNAKIVRVLFPRTANNHKELTVNRGEILEILDDSRKWWKARNSRGQVAHVPHTIVGEVESSLTHLRELSASSQDDWIRRERQDLESKQQLIQARRDIINSPIIIPPIMSQMVIAQKPEQSELPTVKNRPELQAQLTLITTPNDTNSSKNNDNYSISQELSERFKNGHLMRSKSQDNFMSRYSSMTENELTATELAMYLTYKEFTPNLIEFIETLFNIKEINCKLLHWTKAELRSNIPSHVADDLTIQRLHSNLLVLKNTIASSKEDELNFILKQRKQKLIQKFENEDRIIQEEPSSP